MERWLEHFARASFFRSADTAHDLKTPLNVAVLNLELLRMRVRKLTGDEDPKVIEYGRAIEVELRRMAEIFDTFFFLSTPPRNDEVPRRIDASALFAAAAEEAGFQISSSQPSQILAHEPRIRQAFRMFFQGASNVFGPHARQVHVSRAGTMFLAEISGVPSAEDFELTRIFKFYYTDPRGVPDLSLAAARVIAETYGGELKGEEESDKVSLRLSLPLGEE